LPIHSFQTLLADLATIAQNTIVTPITPKYPLIMVTRPTPTQHKAFQLLAQFVASSAASPRSIGKAIQQLARSISEAGASESAPRAASSDCCRARKSSCSARLGDDLTARARCIMAITAVCRPIAAAVRASIGRNGLQVVGYFKDRACRQKQNKLGARRKLHRGSRKK
jgi:hypothetical protein